MDELGKENDRDHDEDEHQEGKGEYESRGRVPGVGHVDRKFFKV